MSTTVPAPAARPADPVLPDGLTCRPLVPADSFAVFELIAAQEKHDIGTVEIEEADLIGEWQRPSHDLTASSLAVLDGERIVAYAEYLGHERYDAAVHPDFRGRGIGTTIARWVQELARSSGAQVIGMPVPEGTAGDRLLADLGYFVRWTSWVLRLPPGRTIAERPLPDGYALRVATEADYEAVWTTVEDAFLEWSRRDRQSFEDCAAETWHRPGFEPWHLQVVTGPDGSVVGTVYCHNSPADDGTLETYVSRLAVSREHRHRGLAQALLVAAFGAGREHGAAASCLSTDSRTGALSLYEKVGMETASVWLHRAISLV